MTQDEIIEMAIEAEFVSHGKLSDEESELFVCVDKDIYKFAKLVAAKVLAQQEQEPVVEMEALADNDSAYAYADGWNACVRKFKATHPPQRTEQEPVAWELGVVNGVVTRRPVARPQPKQEPVAWMTQARRFIHLSESTEAEAKLYGWNAVYTSPPPQRTWVGIEEKDMPDGEDPMFDHKYFIAGMVYANNVLLEKNK